MILLTYGNHIVLYAYAKYDAFEKDGATWTKITKVKGQVKSTANITHITKISGVIQGSQTSRKSAFDKGQLNKVIRKNVSFNNNRKLQSKSVDWGCYHRPDGTLLGMSFTYTVNYYNGSNPEKNKGSTSISITVYAQ